MEPLENVTELDAILEARDWSRAREYMHQLPVQDIAKLLPELSAAHRLLILKLLPKTESTEVFSYLGSDCQDEIIKDLTEREVLDLLKGMAPDDRTALLADLPAEMLRRMLEMLPPQERRKTQTLLGFPEESVGRLMTPNYIAVRPDWSVSRSLAHIRSRHQQAETISIIYVTDIYGKLLDTLGLRRFVLAEPEQQVADIMDHHFTSIEATEDREKAVDLVQHYDLTALPVVDDDGMLLGTVTLDDIMDVAEEEATEDFHQKGSVGSLQLRLRDARPSLLYRKRVGWLVLLVFMNLFGGAAIAHFEETIEAVIALVFFLPLIVDSGGTAGAPSATMMVRARATGAVRMRAWGRLLGKELGVAIALGVTMAVAVFGIGIYRGGLDVGYVVALAMAAVVLFGSLIGMLLPFLLHRMNLDPATASAPLITSLADITGIMIYFTIATMLLPVG